MEISYGYCRETKQIFGFIADPELEATDHENHNNLEGGHNTPDAVRKAIKEQFGEQVATEAAYDPEENHPTIWTGYEFADREKIIKELTEAIERKAENDFGFLVAQAKEHLDIDIKEEVEDMGSPTPRLYLGLSE